MHDHDRRTGPPGHRARRLLVAVAIASLALACASRPSPETRPTASNAPRPGPGNDLTGAPDWILRGCTAYWADPDERGACGVGTASGSRNTALMISTAEARGRTEIARTLGTTVRALLKDYQATTTGGEEFGGAASDEQHLVDVGKQLTDVTVVGAQRRDLWISPGGVVHALMVLDLDQFQSVVWGMTQLSGSLRTHVARNAPKALAAAEGGAAAAPPSVSAGPTGGPLVLVTQAELDALPQDVEIAWGKKKEPDPNGPRIELASPTDGGVYEGPFPIHVEFLPGAQGTPVDMDTLRLEYKLAWGIDITDRVRDYIAGTSIDVAESELPEGRHSVEIRIGDVEGREASRLFTVTVK